MQSKIEKLKGSKVKITITMTPAEMAKHFIHAYEHLAPTVKLDGFRPGKAPRALIESSIGISRIFSEGLEMGMNEGYVKALDENKLQPIASPAIKVNKYPEYGHNESEVKNDFEYEAEVGVFPEIKLGDYSKLKVEKPKKEESKAEDVDKILQNLRKQKANFTEIDRPAKMGDLADISYEGFLKKVKIDQMTSKNHPVVLGEKTLIPGFEENVIGMKKGEKKEFKIKFPKDYHAKEYAGKEAEFNVELNNLKEIKLPEVDDKFALDFGYQTPDELKKAIAKNLEGEMAKRYQAELENRILEKVLPLVKGEIPEALIDQETDRMIEQYREQLTSMGMNFDSYLQSAKKTADDLRKDMRPAAEKNVKIGLMLGRIIEELKLDRKDPEAGKKAIEHLVATLTK